jgi:LPXTG-motif cell wall-anchored protein
MDDYSGHVTVTDEGGELGDFTLTPIGTSDSGTDWVLIGIVAVVVVALLLLLLLFFKRKKK